MGDEILRGSVRLSLEFDSLQTYSEQGHSEISLLFLGAFAPPETDLLPVFIQVLTFGVANTWIGQIKTQAVSPRAFDRLPCRTTVSRWLLRKGLRDVD